VVNNVSLAVMMNHNALFVDQDDRRIVALDINKSKAGDIAYFNEFHRVLVDRHMFICLFAIR